MIKKRRNLFIMLVVIVLMLSTTVGVIVASSNGTRFKGFPEKQPKARSRLILRRKRGDCFGSALILASLITNGTM